MGIPSLIQDLALILMVAGVVTLIFKKHKRLLEFLEYQRYNTCHHENKGKVLY